MPSPDYEPAGTCPHCGYAIDPGRCPECGRDVPFPVPPRPEPNPWFWLAAPLTAVIARLFELIPRNASLLTVGTIVIHAMMIQIAMAALAFVLIGVLGARMRQPLGAFLVALAFSCSYWVPGAIILLLSPGPIDWRPLGPAGVAMWVAGIMLLSLSATLAGYLVSVTRAQPTRSSDWGPAP